MSWGAEIREGMADVAAALNRIADEQAIANRLAVHNSKMSRADAEWIVGAARTSES